MDNLRDLFGRYNKIVVFDTETTGLSPKQDSIIQFSAVVLEPQLDRVEIAKTYNELISLPYGMSVPPEITRLTGITNEALRDRGIPRQQAAADIAELFSGKPLLCAYNAQFDLTFVFFLLCRHGFAEALQNKDKLDLLTVYRDRRSYPHKLCNAIESYHLDGVVQNSHSADDDALAAAWVMDAMAGEEQDLMNYVNLFGYIPKFGLPKPAIRSITYLPQPYDPAQPLYMSLRTAPASFSGNRFSAGDLSGMGRI